MQQAVLTFMANHMATKEDQIELKKTFLQFDENGDGLIQRHEFINGYKKLSQNKDKDPEDVEKEAMKIFAEADIDGNGEIDFGEWSTSTIN